MNKNPLFTKNNFKGWCYMRLTTKNTVIIAVVLTVCMSALLVTVGFVLKNKHDNPEMWVLHSYGNNVALYIGEKIIEVYGSIMLDTLPDEDKRLLDNGIFFSTKEEAQNAVEDYDG